jgi:hypothetical protein
MLPLNGHFDQTRRFQSIQVYAGGGWTHLGHYCKLRAGTGAAIHQAVEHAGSRRLTDGGRDSGNGGVRILNNHTLIIDEVYPQNNWHTPYIPHDNNLRHSL